MLNSNGLRQIIEQLRLSPEALEILAAVRGRPPSRHVNQAFGNVSARYPSRKMGWTIQAESHRVELAAIHDMEYDANVLEYYDQPGTIPLRYRAISGRAVSVQHTPDFFVIRRDWIGWEEWKPEARLRDLARLMPGRYALANGGESGDWRCPPGEAYARQVGLNYRVRSDAEIDWTMQRNIQFMADYWRAGGSVSDDLIVKKIHAWFVHEQTEGMREVMPLTEVLLRANEGGIASDKVYAMIALGELWVDLRAAPLAEPQRVMVHLTPSEDSLEKRAVNPILADTDVEALPSHIVLRQLTQEGRTILQTASPQALAVANDRWAALRSVLDQAGDINSASDAVIPERTLFRWRRRIREAEQKYGSGYVGLLPRYGERGNRNRRLDAEVLTLMDQLAEDTYETAKRRNVKSVFGTLVIECQDRALTAPSYRTFLRVIKMRPRVKLMERREGKRSAYVATPFYWELNLTTPRHGDRPFEIGHIDHTELDIELVCSLTGRPLGRPWLTFLVDAFSRRVLAFWLSYEPPSYRSCMMILRECVRRHHRLPQTIVVDGGKEFESVYFETLLHVTNAQRRRDRARNRALAQFASDCLGLQIRCLCTIWRETPKTAKIRDVDHAHMTQNAMRDGHCRSFLNISRIGCARCMTPGNTLHLTNRRCKHLRWGRQPWAHAPFSASHMTMISLRRQCQQLKKARRECMKDMASRSTTSATGATLFAIRL